MREATLGTDFAIQSVQQSSAVRGAQLPLAMVHDGSIATVAKIRGNQGFRQHLAELGFTEGAEVKLVSSAHGDVVVCVKGATFGIDRQTAMRIVTC